MALTAMHRFPLRSAGSSRISRHMSKKCSIAFRRRTQSYADFFSWRYSHRSYNDACMGLLHGIYLVHVLLSPASLRQSHCSRSCLSRLQFGRPNCAASPQPFSRTACERLPHSPVTEWHVAPIECIVAHLLYPTYRTSNLIISCAGLASIEKSTGQVRTLSLKVSRYSK